MNLATRIVVLLKMLRLSVFFFFFSNRTPDVSSPLPNNTGSAVGDKNSWERSRSVELPLYKLVNSTPTHTPPTPPTYPHHHPSHTVIHVRIRWICRGLMWLTVERRTCCCRCCELSQIQAQRWRGKTSDFHGLYYNRLLPL